MSSVITPPPMTIYCARPMTGCDRLAVVNYYGRVVPRLSAAGFRVFTPICGKYYPLEHATGSAAAACRWAPVVTDRAIKKRDQWMVRNSSVIFVNLSQAVQVSEGSIMELAWADVFGVHSVLVPDTSGIHRHPMVFECADIVFPAEEAALLYLEELARGGVLSK